MSSSKEAFLKFAMWRDSNTVLKLTMLTNDEKPEILFVEITGIDSEMLLVSFVKRGTRLIRTLDLVGASFDVGKRALEAKDPQVGVLMFEEMANSNPGKPHKK